MPPPAWCRRGSGSASPPPPAAAAAAATAGVTHPSGVEPGLGVEAHGSPLGPGRRSPAARTVTRQYTRPSLMITAHHLEVRAGRAAADGRRQLPGRAGRQGRPGRPQRRRQDHAHQDPRRRGRCPPPATVTRPATVGYLPQDPRTGDLDVLARDRILSARGLDDVVRRLREAEAEMAQRRRRRCASGRCGATSAPTPSCTPAAATPPSPRPPRSRQPRASPDRVLGQPLRTLSGGQRRRVELARILFSGAETLLLDEPTNHLDADSIVWLREFLQGAQGRAGRDQPRRRRCSRRRSTGCSTSTPTGPRSTSTTWAGRRTCTQRETDERRRKRERANAEKQGRRR